jgi:hypothetical protein
MAKTYLQLVNEVLKRVREPTVATVSENLYSILISTYINDAKQQVEDAWNWEALNTSISFSLAPSTITYDLSSTALVGSGNELNERSRLLYDPCTREPMAFDRTSPNQTRLKEVSAAYQRAAVSLGMYSGTYATPTYFAINPDNSAIYVSLVETPSAVRTWRMYFKKPQTDLSAGTDVIKVPWLPVVLLATNYALNERGEEIGEPGNVAEQRYRQALGDAIALDSRYTEASTTFTPD